MLAAPVRGAGMQSWPAVQVVDTCLAQQPSLAAVDASLDTCLHQLALRGTGLPALLQVAELQAGSAEGARQRAQQMVERVLLAALDLQLQHPSEARHPAPCSCIPHECPLQPPACVLQLERLGCVSALHGLKHCGWAGKASLAALVHSLEGAGLAQQHGAWLAQLRSTAWGAMENASGRDAVAQQLLPLMAELLPGAPQPRYAWGTQCGPLVLVPGSCRGAR